jgi:hypothetical protein
MQAKPLSAARANAEDVHLLTRNFITDVLPPDQIRLAAGPAREPSKGSTKCREHAETPWDEIVGLKLG